MRSVFVMLPLGMLSGLLLHALGVKPGEASKPISPELLLVLWLVLHMLDLHSTARFISKGGGIEREGNPITRWCMKRFGAVKGLSAHSIFVVLPLTGLLYIGALYSHYVYFGWLVLVVIVTLVVIFNYSSAPSPSEKVE